MLAGSLALGMATTVTLYGASGAYDDDQAAWWVSALMVLANTAPIAFRRRYPMSVLVVVALAFVGTQLLHVPELFVVNFTLFIALYTVGAWCSDRVRAEAVRWVVIGGMFAWLFLAIVFRWSMPTALPNDGDALIPPYIAYSLLNVLINVVYFGAAWYAGNRAGAPRSPATSSTCGPPNSPRSANARLRRPSRSSASGSPANCTTSSPTTWP